MSDCSISTLGPEYGYMGTPMDTGQLRGYKTQSSRSRVEL